MTYPDTKTKFSRLARVLISLAVLQAYISVHAEQGSYVPQAIYCADGSNQLCASMPSMIGSDPAISPGVGYHGLPASVTGFDRDSQSPFDNMAWQMFIAANWASDASESGKSALNGQGSRVWQSWKRPQDIFGGEAPLCSNPNNLPRMSIMSKTGGQPDARMDGILEASSGKPLIDRNGNWVMFDRRLNPIEEQFLTKPRIDKSGKMSFVYTLKSVDGQRRYIKQLQKENKAFQFPAGEDLFAASAKSARTNGKVGAIEMKTAWRIIQAGEPVGNYFTMKALLEVSGDMVFNAQPICQEVTLGLIGMHIVQKNPARGDLRDQWIWATFEHRDNAPLSSDPATPVDFASYGKYPNSNCPLTQPATNKLYSLYNPGCSSCVNNAPPALGSDSLYVWNPIQPFAQHYLTKDKQGSPKYGTQVVQCAESYSLTAEIDQQWRNKLMAIDSVFANYTLIGTQWGADIEQTAPPFVQRNAVPDFLSNTTMETYLQTGECQWEGSAGNKVCVKVKGAGSCVDCHQFGTLAAKDAEGNSVKSDFSFLPGLAKDFDNKMRDMNHAKQIGEK